MEETDVHFERDFLPREADQEDLDFEELRSVFGELGTRARDIANMLKSGFTNRVLSYKEQLTISSAKLQQAKDDLKLLTDLTDGYARRDREIEVLKEEGRRKYAQK